MDTKTNQSKHNAGTPNQKALDEFINRYLWWKSRQALNLRSKKLKGRNRAASIKIRP